MKKIIVRCIRKRMVHGDRYKPTFRWDMGCIRKDRDVNNLLKKRKVYVNNLLFLSHVLLVYVNNLLFLSYVDIMYVEVQKYLVMFRRENLYPKFLLHRHCIMNAKMSSLIYVV